MHRNVVRKKITFSVVSRGFQLNFQLVTTVALKEIKKGFYVCFFSLCLNSNSGTNLFVVYVPGYVGRRVRSGRVAVRNNFLSNFDFSGLDIQEGIAARYLCNISRYLLAFRRFLFMYSYRQQSCGPLLFPCGTAARPQTPRTCNLLSIHAERPGELPPSDRNARSEKESDIFVF